MSESALVRPVMPELDSVRGIAVLMVVIYHGLAWSAATEHMHGVARLIVELSRPGWLGVQLFFVLSGFLITGILIDGRSRRDYYRRFYYRRALRILPAYGALLLLLVITGVAQLPFVATSVFFAANLTSLIGVPMQYGPLWSLSVEEQFYLLWPTAVRKLSRRQLTVAAAAIVLLVPLLRLLAFRHGVVEDLYVQTWYVADSLAMGALGAIFLRSEGVSRRRLQRLSVSLVVTGFLILAAGAPFGIFHRTVVVGAVLQIAPWNLIFTGFIGLVILLGTGGRPSLVTIPWLRFFGRISYGLYLVHLVVFSTCDALIRQLWPDLFASIRGSVGLLLVRLVVAGSLAVLVSTLSREYFEEFFLRLKDRSVPNAETVAAPSSRLESA